MNERPPTDTQTRRAPHRRRFHAHAAVWGMLALTGVVATLCLRNGEAVLLSVLWIGAAFTIVSLLDALGS